MACSAAPLTSPGTGSLLALGCCRFAGGHQLLARLAKLTAQEVEHLPLGDLKLDGDRAREVWEASFEDSDHLRGEAVHLAGDIGSNHPLAVAGQLFHFLLASQDFVLLELLGLDPGVDGLGVFSAYPEPLYALAYRDWWGPPLATGYAQPPSRRRARPRWK